MGNFESAELLILMINDNYLLSEDKDVIHLNFYKFTIITLHQNCGIHHSCLSYIMEFLTSVQCARICVTVTFVFPLVGSDQLKEICHILEIFILWTINGR